MAQKPKPKSSAPAETSATPTELTFSPVEYAMPEEIKKPGLYFNPATGMIELWVDGQHGRQSALHAIKNAAGKRMVLDGFIKADYWGDNAQVRHLFLKQWLGKVGSEGRLPDLADLAGVSGC